MKQLSLTDLSILATSKIVFFSLPNMVKVLSFILLLKILCILLADTVPPIQKNIPDGGIIVFMSLLLVKLLISNLHNFLSLFCPTITKCATNKISDGFSSIINPCFFTKIISIIEYTLSGLT